MASVDLQENANFTRLSRLLVDKGTEAFRNTFDTIHPPASLPAVLKAKRKPLLRLKFRIINATQWDLLYPPSGNPPDSKTFDVTLLTILLRNICGLSAPTTGWNAKPSHTDRSLVANIARVKGFRNDVYAHVTSTKVDNSIFESLWQNIAQALVELKIPKNDIDDLKNSPLADEEEIYMKTLKEWKIQEDECIEVIERVDADLRNVSDDVKSMECSINRLENRMEVTNKSVHKGLGVLHSDSKSDFKSLGCSIDRLTQAAEESRDEIQQLRLSTSLQQNTTVAYQCSIAHSSQVPEDTKHEQSCKSYRGEDLLQKLAKHNFKNKIKRKVKFFLPGTREWLLKKLHDWFIKKEDESKSLLLTAGPGFGKSVFAAKVCEDFKEKKKLAACHFCDFSDANLRDPMMMLQSLASQMCENVPGFREKLLDQLKRPHQIRTLKDAFGIYLRNPLDELELEEPFLIVIDGLDESATDNKSEIVSLIASYFPDFPEYIKVLVTSRPEIFVAKLEPSHLQKVNVESGDTENNLDLGIYLSSCLPNFDGRDLRILVDKCEGSFLYAYYIQSELLNRDNLDTITIDEISEFLPKGLNSIYYRYFKRLEEELQTIVNENLDVLKILQLLAASKGCLPLTFVSRVLGLIPDCRETKRIINKVNGAVSCLLYVSDDLVTIFHKSVIDWLLANGYEDHEYVVAISDGNRSLWLLCEQVFEEIKKTVCSGYDLNQTNEVAYALDNGLHYLIECNVEKSFFWAVDVVIVYMLMKKFFFRVDFLVKIWNDILCGNVVINSELRARISWHYLEIRYQRSRFRSSNLRYHYLKSVITHSPFSEHEKNTAKLILSKVPLLVESKMREVAVQPQAIMDMGYTYRFSTFGRIGVSCNKKMAAFSDLNGIIFVVSVPELINLWQYSIGFKDDFLPCTFAPDDSYVLFGKLETVLNIAERREVPFFQGNKETFTSCAFSAQGKRLVTTNGSSVIKLWDVARQSLLSLLNTDFPVDTCTFNDAGLFIIEGSDDDSFCVWDAISWQRTDERNLPRRELRSEKCNRCHQPRFFRSIPSKQCTDFSYSDFSKSYHLGCDFCYFGIYDERRQRVFGLEEYSHSFRLTNNTHFTTQALFNTICDTYNPRELYGEESPLTLIAIEDQFLYADGKLLIVFRTSPTLEQSFVPNPDVTCVLWCSFSPDSSRLATCTSDGNINIWNVDTNQVVQRCKMSHGQAEGSFACWWSTKFLFVVSINDLIPVLLNYPVDVNFQVIFTAGQKLSLSNEVDCSWNIDDISKGILILWRRRKMLVIVIDVNERGRPRMITLPGTEFISRGYARFAVSPDASFILALYNASHDFNYYCRIWKRNAKEPADYNVLLTSKRDGTRRSSGRIPSVLEDLGRVFGSVISIWSGQDYRYVDAIDLDTDDCGTLPLIAYFSDYNFVKLCYESKDIVHVTERKKLVFNMDLRALLGSSIRWYLTDNLMKKTNLSPNHAVLAFPKINGDMEFLRVCIPQNE